MALTLFFGLGTGVMFTFLPTFGEGLGVHSVSLFYTAYALAAVASAGLIAELRELWFPSQHPTDAEMAASLTSAADVVTGAGSGAWNSAAWPGPSRRRTSVSPRRSSRLSRRPP